MLVFIEFFFFFSTMIEVFIIYCIELYLLTNQQCDGENISFITLCLNDHFNLIEQNENVKFTGFQLIEHSSVGL